MDEDIDTTCWYCQQKVQFDGFFASSFDTFVHYKCIAKVLHDTVKALDSSVLKDSGLFEPLTIAADELWQLGDSCENDK